MKSCILCKKTKNRKLEKEQTDREKSVCSFLSLGLQNGTIF
ncbi:hypothetical protein [Bacillus thuringiensis]|nr:hypothetical protein [Bacillus thuringiensis]